MVKEKDPFITKRWVLNLTIHRLVTKNGTIDTSIRAEVSSPIMVSEMKSYKITTRQAQTRVRLQPGEVLVIGGLMDNRDQKQIEKIPILGDIPLLGKLFRHSRKTKDSVEIGHFCESDCGIIIVTE